MTSTARHAGRWLGFATLYLVFAGQLAVDECVTAALLASLATVVSVRQERNADRRFHPVSAHVACWASAAAGLGPASVRVGVRLVRVVVRGGSPGQARRVEFARGPERDLAASGRRATALLAASLAPHSFVVRAEPGRDEVLIHAILPERGQPDRLWLS